MKQYNLAILPLYLHSMQEGAFDGDVINFWWKVGQTKVDDYFFRGGSTINTPTLFPFILSQRNRVAGAFDLALVKMEWGARLSTGKKGMIAVVEYMPRIQMDQIEGGNGLLCDTSDSIAAGYQKYPYELKYTTTTKKIMVDNATVKCLQQGKEEFSADSIANGLSAAVSLLARDVEAVIYDIDNGYIGDFPDRFQGVNLSPGKELALFRDPANAYNEVNWVGEDEMQADMMQSAVGEFVMFGARTAKRYAKLREISGANTSQGFDITKADTFMLQNFFYDDYLQLGIKNIPAPNDALKKDPLLVYRPGALQFISRARTENEDYQIALGDQISTTVVDPVWGLTWEMQMKLEQCPSDGEYKWFTWFRLDWTVIGYPQCDSTEDPKLSNVTDVFLYNVACKDTPVCTMPVDKINADMTSLALDDNCSLDQVCDPGCSIALYGNFLSGGDFQIIAIPSPALGADALIAGDYAWTVNGGAVATPTDPNVLVLAAGAYANGDTIELTITDSTGCIGVANVVAVVPELQVTIDDGTTSNTLADGGTETLTSVAVASSPTVNVALANLGLDPLTITTWTLTGDVVAGYIQPTVPATAPTDIDFTFDVSGGAGVKTVTLTINSNDPTTPAYTATIDITLT
jgi:hypothetical protein